MMYSISLPSLVGVFNRIGERVGSFLCWRREGRYHETYQMKTQGARRQGKPMLQVDGDKSRTPATRKGHNAEKSMIPNSAGNAV